MTKIPRPSTDDLHTAYICPKCSGTGIFAVYVLDGQPYSPTGTACWRCNGTGWTIRAKRGVKKAFWANVKPVRFDEHGKPIQEP